MSLEQWLQNGWLRRNDTTVTEVQQLLAVVERSLKDAKVTALSTDGRFQHAYDAALQLCLVALRAEGFVVRKGAGHHKHGIDSLSLTLGSEWSETADHIERCSRLRGQAVYERTEIASDKDVAELVETVEKLNTFVRQWLSDKHPDLLIQSKRK